MGRDWGGDDRISDKRLRHIWDIWAKINLNLFCLCDSIDKQIWECLAIPRFEKRLGDWDQKEWQCSVRKMEVRFGGQCSASNENNENIENIENQNQILTEVVIIWMSGAIHHILLAIRPSLYPSMHPKIIQTIDLINCEQRGRVCCDWVEWTPIKWCILRTIRCKYQSDLQNIRFILGKRSNGSIVVSDINSTIETNG